MRSDRIRIFDMPWDGNRANLEMVAGSDDLLSFLDTEGKQSVTIHVVPSETPLEVEGYVRLRMRGSITVQI